MAAKLGDFFVNISTKSDTKGIKEVSTGLDGLLGKAKKLAVAYLSFKGAKALVGAADTIIKDAAELGRFSQDLGIATQDLESFGRAFELVGAGADDAYSVIRNLTKAIPAMQMGDESMAEAFGILGLGPQNFTNDALQNFDQIRKRFATLSSAQQLYFADTVGLSEKSLRVLRLNDEAYAQLLKTSKEAPLITDKQIKKADDYAKKIQGLNQAIESLERNLAVNKSADLLGKGAKKLEELANKGADYFAEESDESIAKRKFNREYKKERARIADEKIKEFGKTGTKGLFDQFLEINDPLIAPIKKKLKPFSDKFSDVGRLSERGRILADDQTIPLAVSQAKMNSGNSGGVVNNFNNTTEISVENGNLDQRELAATIADSVESVYLKNNKEAAQNFKRGFVQ